MKTDLSPRLSSRIDASAGPDACWPWTGQKTRAGYGRLNDAKAHRLVFEEANGPIPAGKLVCHRCDNPICVNPAHLFAGDYTANIRDMMRKGRQRFWGKAPISTYAGAEYLELADVPERLADIRDVSMG